MVLVDTSVWVDHLRSMDAELVRLLESARVLAHPFVIGEIALGALKQRQMVIGALLDLPRAQCATDGEVMGLIDQARLAGRGIGFVDAHLIAATKLTAGARLWTRDKRLGEVAAGLGLAHTSGS